MDANHARIPGDLPALWRERAAFLHQYGDSESARLWQLAAVELEWALKAFGDETLSLVEAARVSGYTADHLGGLVKRGKIPNAGCTGAPRIRRADLSDKKPNGPGRPRRRRPLDIYNHQLVVPECGCNSRTTAPAQKNGLHEARRRLGRRLAFVFG